MKIFRGISASPGYVSGRVTIHRAASLDNIPQYTILPEQIKHEQQRFDQAIIHAVRELERVKEHVFAELGETEANIFESHIVLLQDPELVKRVHNHLRTNLVNVEQAVAKAVNELGDTLATINRDYFKERVSDIHDIGNRIIRNLRQESTHYLPNNEDVANNIVIAKEITPSDMIGLNKYHPIAGLVLEEGSVTSHAIILTRSRGIPAIIGIPNLLKHITPGNQAILDGEKGLLTLNPSKNQVHRFYHKKSEYEQRIYLMESEEEQLCETQDGKRLQLFANINLPQELSLVKKHHLEGIDLFRTEFLFMEASRAPSMNKQTNIYKRIAQSIMPLPLVIRTLDIGGDKYPTFLESQHGISPYSGLRGLHFSLQEKTLLRTQLRAMMRAHAEFNNIHILLPMVIRSNDIRQVLTLLEALKKKEELDSLPSLGAMIETPSAIFELEAIIKLVDFISIGTNDLAQYMLATEHTSLNTFTAKNTSFPALLQAVKQIAEIGDKLDCPVSICGEIASDPFFVGLLASIGIERFSISPVYASPVRYALRNINLQTIQSLIPQILNAGNEHNIIEILKEHYPPMIQKFDP